jgi:hypothetical protein
LGATVASFAAAKLVKEFNILEENLKLVTFGQPRTGNTEWAREMDNIVNFFMNNLYKIIYFYRSKRINIGLFLEMTLCHFFPPKWQFQSQFLGRRQLGAKHTILGRVHPGCILLGKFGIRAVPKLVPNSKCAIRQMNRKAAALFQSNMIFK